MPKPIEYSFYVGFTAMNIEQAIEYIHDLDDKDIRNCLQVHE